MSTTYSVARNAESSGKPAGYGTRAGAPPPSVGAPAASIGAPVVRRGMPPIRAARPAPARGPVDDEGEVPAAARLHRKFHLSFMVPINPKKDIHPELAVMFNPEDVRRQLIDATGDPNAKLDTVLVESIDAHVQNGTEYPLSVRLLGDIADKTVTESHNYYDCNGCSLASGNMTVHPNTSKTAALYSANKLEQRIIRKHAPSVTDMHTEESLSAHETVYPGLAGVHVDIASPVLAHMDVKPSDYDRACRMGDKCRVDDVAPYNTVKRNLIDASIQQTANHIDLTNFGIAIAHAVGKPFTAMPPHLEPPKTPADAAIDYDAHASHAAAVEAHTNSLYSVPVEVTVNILHDTVAKHIPV